MKNDLRVEVALKNNTLYELIFSQFESVHEFCFKADLNDVAVGKLLNLKTDPRKGKGGAWTRAADKISEYFKLLPEDIFPESLYKIKQTRFQIETQSTKIQSISSNMSYEQNIDKFLLTDAISTIFDSIPPREAKVIKLRIYEGKTLEECGDILGVGRERVRQIEARGMRRLRTPDRERVLRPFYNEIT